MLPLMVQELRGMQAVYLAMEELTSPRPTTIQLFHFQRRCCPAKILPHHRNKEMMKGVTELPTALGSAWFGCAEAAGHLEETTCIKD